MSINIHGTITAQNYSQCLEDTQKYGPIRLALSRVVVQALDKTGWQWSLDGGDLLGALRNGKMLPHDDDFDFWIYTEEITSMSNTQQKTELLNKMCQVVKQFLPQGIYCRVVNTYAFKLQVYDPQHGKYQFRYTDYHNATCDLTLIAPIQPNQPQDKIYVTIQHQHNYKYNMKYEKKYLVPVIPNGIVFEGYKYNCPANTEKYLQGNYGYIGTDAIYDKQTGYYKKKQPLGQGKNI